MRSQTTIWIMNSTPSVEEKLTRNNKYTVYGPKTVMMMKMKIMLDREYVNLKIFLHQLVLWRVEFNRLAKKKTRLKK